MTFLAEPPPSPAATELYDADVASDGYVNNLTRLWAWRPEVLAGWRAATGAVTAGTTLTRRELAVLVVGTAAAREDAYCGLAWGGRLAGLASPAVAAGILTGPAGASGGSAGVATGSAGAPGGSAGVPGGLTDREVALLGWCRAVVGDPNGTTAADVTALRDAGLTDQEVFDATAWTALRMAFSTVNAALGAAPDAALADTAPAEVRTATTYGRPPA